jgi:hypothetical protein
MIAAALAPAAGLGAGATVAVGAAAAAAVDLGKGYNAGAPFTETAFNIFWDTALAAIVPELKIPCVKGIAKFVDPYIRKNFHRLGQWHGAVSFIRKHIGDKHEVEKFEMTLKDLEAAHLEKDVEAHLIELIESYAVSQTFNRNMVDLLFDAGQQVLLAVLQTDYQIVVAKKPMTVGDAVKNFKSALGLGDWATLEAAKAHLGPIFEQAAQKMV